MNEYREDQIPDLVALATSENFRDRVAAANRLTRLVDVPTVRPWLHRLVLDDEDTAVSEAAARALTVRGDELALRVLAGAISIADDNQLDWITEGVQEALATSAEVRNRASAFLERMLSESPAAKDPGVLRLLAALSPTRP